MVFSLKAGVSRSCTRYSTVVRMSPRTSISCGFRVMAVRGGKKDGPDHYHVYECLCAAVHPAPPTHQRQTSNRTDGRALRARTRALRASSRVAPLAKRWPNCESANSWIPPGFDWSVLFAGVRIGGGCYRLGLVRTTNEPLRGPRWRDDRPLPYRVTYVPLAPTEK